MGLPQGDLQLVQFVKQNLLVTPAPKDAKYNLKNMQTKDPSLGHGPKIRAILKNKVCESLFFNNFK